MSRGSIRQLACALVGSLAASAPSSAALHGTPVRGQPYERFETTDHLDRRITYYLSESRPSEAPLPLVVFVHGSGCTSHFTQHGDRLRPRNGHISFAEAVQGRARLLIVEKPGVSFLDDPVTYEERSGSPAFRAEHTLERWAEAVAAAIRAAQARPDVAASGALIVGHSEGGIVAACVARQEPERISHVASLAGGGPSQLFSLVQLARDGAFFAHVSDDPEERVAHVLAQWERIREDPLSTERLFLGFAYRRWASFLARSIADELRAGGARVYIAQGLADTAVSPVSADMLYTELLRCGRDVTYDRVEDADHSFVIRRDGETIDRWRRQVDRVLAWYLDGG